MAVICLLGKTRSDSSEGTSVTSVASPASSEKKDDSARDTAGRVTGDKHCSATDKVTATPDRLLNAAVLRGLAKAAAKADQGGANATRNSVEKENGSDGVNAACDAGKSGASSRDTAEEKGEDQGLTDGSVESKDGQGAGGVEEGEEKEAVKKCADDASSVSRRNSSERRDEDVQGKSEAVAECSKSKSRAGSPADRGDSSPSRKRVAEEALFKEDVSSQKKSRLNGIINTMLASGLEVAEEPMHEDESEEEEAMDSDSGGSEHAEEEEEEEEEATSSPSQSQDRILISPEVSLAHPVWSSTAWRPSQMKKTCIG